MTLPAPLTPPDCDLQDFKFMPMDVQRLRDSDLAANEAPDACWAAVLLWAASWHQVPAGSIPKNDQWIAKQAGYLSRGKVDKAWAAVRDGALRGFVECSDGRLYHVVVSEKAREAWQAKVEQRYRTEAARIKKHNQRHETKHPIPTFEDWLSAGRPQGHHLHVPGDTHKDAGDKAGDNASKGQGEGEGQGQGQGQGDSGSVPAGTGAEAPSAPKPKVKTSDDMARAELWRAAVSVLENGGCPISQCRTFMGKLVQDYTFEVVQQAVGAAVTNQPVDAREYLKATCQRISGERASTRKPNATTERRSEMMQGLAGDESTTGNHHDAIDVPSRFVTA